MALDTFGGAPSDVVTNSAGDVIALYTSGVDAGQPLRFTVWADAARATQVTTLYAMDGITALPGYVTPVTTAGGNFGRVVFKASDVHPALWLWDGNPDTTPWLVWAREIPADIKNGLVQSAAALAGLASKADQTDLDATNATVTGKVTKGALVFNVKDYGAVGDYVADDTTAFSTALSAAGAAGGAVVFVPSGTYKISSPLAVPTGCVLRGAGNGSWVRGSGLVTTETISLSGVHHVTIENVRISGSGGHAINASDVYYLNIARAYLQQYAVGKSIIYHQGTGSFIDVQVTESALDTIAGNTVAAVYLENSANKLAATRWKGLRLNGANVTAAPFFRLVNTGAGNWAHDHTFQDITAELCVGGVIWGSSVFGVTVDAVAPWDVTTYSDHCFQFDKNASSTASRGIIVRSSGRRGGAMGAGKSDVYFSSDCQDVLVDNCRPSTGTIVVTLPTSYGVVRNCGEGRTERHSYGGSIKLSYPATGDRPTAAAAGVGGMVYDSTLGKPIWSNGTVWKDASGTTV